MSFWFVLGLVLVLIGLYFAWRFFGLVVNWAWDPDGGEKMVTPPVVVWMAVVLLVFTGIMMMVKS